MEDHRRSLRVTINGASVEREVEPRLLLSDFIRHEAGLTGTHVGCEHGVCGACTVLVDGDPVRSCLMFAVQGDGAAVETVESLADGETLHPLQEAFRREHGLQCGYCTPGILMTLKPFLAANPAPTDVRDSPRALGQSLPLHRLPADRGGGAPGGGDAAGREPVTTRLIGEPVERREDARLLTGAGALHRRYPPAGHAARGGAPQPPRQGALHTGGCEGGAGAATACTR